MPKAIEMMKGLLGQPTPEKIRADIAGLEKQIAAAGAKVTEADRALQAAAGSSQDEVSRRAIADRRAALDEQETVRSLVKAKRQALAVAEAEEQRGADSARESVFVKVAEELAIEADEMERCLAAVAASGRRFRQKERALIAALPRMPKWWPPGMNRGFRLFVSMRLWALSSGDLGDGAGEPFVKSLRRGPVGDMVRKSGESLREQCFQKKQEAA